MGTHEQQTPRRVALGTGGTRGIGAAITRTVARDGTHVAGVYAHDHENAARFDQESGVEEVSISIHQANIANPGDCTRLVHEVLHQFGRIDYLVKCSSAARGASSTLVPSSAKWAISARSTMRPRRPGCSV